MKSAVHLVLWVFVGALIVLVVTHATGFAQAVSAVGGQVTNNAVLLAGGNPTVSTGSKTNPSGLSTSSYTGLGVAA